MEKKDEKRRKSVRRCSSPKDPFTSPHFLGENFIQKQFHIHTLESSWTREKVYLVELKIEINESNRILCLSPHERRRLLYGPAMHASLCSHSFSPSREQQGEPPQGISMLKIQISPRIHGNNSSQVPAARADGTSFLSVQSIPDLSLCAAHDLVAMLNLDPSGSLSFLFFFLFLCRWSLVFCVPFSWFGGGPCSHEDEDAGGGGLTPPYAHDVVPPSSTLWYCSMKLIFVSRHTQKPWHKLRLWRGAAEVKEQNSSV